MERVREGSKIAKISKQREDYGVAKVRTLRKVAIYTPIKL